MKNRIGFLSFLTGFTGIIVTVAVLAYFAGNQLPVIPITIALIAGVAASLFVAVKTGQAAVNMQINSLLDIRNMLKEYYFSNHPYYEEPRDYEIAHPVKFIFNELINIDKSLVGLKKEIAKHERLFDKMNEGIIMADSEGKIFTINPSAQKIFDIDEPAEGLNLAHVIKESSIISATWDIVDKKVIDNKEVSFKDRKGNTYYVFIARVDIGAANEGIILYIRDMTSTVKAEQIRTDFTANVSHELKTPLTSIKGFAELLKSGSVTDEETKNKYLGLILLESERLINLINDILKISQLDSIWIDEGKTLTDLSRLAEETVSLLSPVAKSHNVKLELDVSPCFCNANPSRLKELFINLIENAIKYNKKDGSVKVSVLCSDENAVIRVSDTGIGIPQDEKDRVFERFYRVEKSRSKATGGTGLGLSIVKHIVKLYRGNIDLESTVGKGTTVEVKLPKAG